MLRNLVSNHRSLFLNYGNVFKFLSKNPEKGARVPLWALKALLSRVTVSVLRAYAPFLCYGFYRVDYESTTRC